MAIKGAGLPPGLAKKAVDTVATTGRNPADVLADMGLIKTPWDTTPPDAVRELLNIFAGAGLIPRPDGAKAGTSLIDEQKKLADVVKQFQAKEGLPQTGRLDDKTVDAMKNARAAPPEAPAPVVERIAVSQQKQDASRRVNNARDTAIGQSIHQRVPEDAWRNFTGATRAPVTAAASSSSTNQFQSAMPQQPPPQANTPPPANQALPQNPPPPTLNPANTAPPKAPSPAAPPPASVVTSQAQTSQQPATQNPVTAAPPAATTHPPSTAPSTPNPVTSTQQGAGLPTGQQGIARPDVNRPPPLPNEVQGSGKKQETPGGNAPENHVELFRGDAPLQVSFQDGVGNQATGDENQEDERRGQALVDDGSGADEGAYEVPSLRQQIRDALRSVRKEVDADPNRPTTYGAQFVLYKPGVYQSATNAPCVLNLTVDRATAFDEIWPKALEQLNTRLTWYEPDGDAMSMEDVHVALQRARVFDA